MRTDHLAFHDIVMKSVKNALIISEYYPKIMSLQGVSAAPVTRLALYFHDVAIENVTATGSRLAEAIEGLPESPVAGVVLRNVRISAEKGLTIGCAQVTGKGVVVQAADGQQSRSSQGQRFC